MITNHLKVAWRHVVKERTFSLINLFGFSVSTAATLLIAAYVMDETSYEDFHVNRDQVYRIGIEFGSEGDKQFMAGAMPALARAIGERSADVLAATRIRQYSGASLTVGEEEYRQSKLFFADSTVFDLFSFDMILGDARTALTQPFSVVLTESLAKNYFGERNALGQTILYQEEHALEVTGVIRDVPINTILRPEIMVSYATLAPIGKASERPWNGWGHDHTFVLLAQGATPEQLTPVLSDLLLENTNEWFASMISFRLHRLSDIYLTSEARGDLGPKGSRTLVILLSAVALLIMILAGANYVILATARSELRLRNLQMQRLLGASRRQLATQLLAETFGFAFIAVLIGLAIFEVAGPPLYGYLGSNLLENSTLRPNLFLLSGLTVLATGLLAGGYPAVSLALRSRASGARNLQRMKPSGANGRRALVVLQFGICALLILSTVTVYRQIEYMRNSDLGFDKQDVILVRWNGSPAATEYTTIRDRFLQVPGVSAVSGAYTPPGVYSSYQMSVRSPDLPEDSSIQIRVSAVDAGFCQALGLEVLQGQRFSDFSSAAVGRQIMINEAAASFLNMDEPVGQSLLLPLNGEFEELTVAGVVQDFHIGSFERAIQPLLLYVDHESYIHLAIRSEGHDLASLAGTLEATWQEVFPDRRFHWQSLEDTYDQLYGPQETMGRLVTGFATLALIISGLGLFGLAAFMTERRTREIGIRKVLGASISGVVSLLSREFMMLVLVANLVAWPVAYYAMNRWLENFAYRVTIGWEFFALVGLATLALAVATVSYQAIRAARANPVDALKYE